MRRYMSVAMVMVLGVALILSACSSGKGPQRKQSRLPKQRLRSKGRGNEDCP